MADFAFESFGQKLDLCARLREILGAYPEGTSILRELIQNAVRQKTLLAARSQHLQSGAVSCRACSELPPRNSAAPTLSPVCTLVPFGASRMTRAPPS